MSASLYTFLITFWCFLPSAPLVLTQTAATTSAVKPDAESNGGESVEVKSKPNGSKIEDSHCGDSKVNTNKVHI